MLTPLAFVSSLLPISTLSFHGFSLVQTLFSLCFQSSNHNHNHTHNCSRHLNNKPISPQAGHAHQPPMSTALPATQTAHKIRAVAPLTITADINHHRSTTSHNPINQATAKTHPTPIQFELVHNRSSVVHHLRAQLSSHHNLLSTPKLSATTTTAVISATIQFWVTVLFDQISRLWNFKNLNIWSWSFVLKQYD